MSKLDKDISSVQSLSCVPFFVTPWTAARKSSLSITISWSLLRFMSIESVMLTNHLILCCPLLLPSVFPRVRVFRSSAYFLIRLVAFLVLSCMNLYLLEINPLSVVSFAIIFSHSEGCLFTLLIVSFLVQKLLSLIKSHLFISVLI